MAKKNRKSFKDELPKKDVIKKKEVTGEETPYVMDCITEGCDGKSITTFCKKCIKGLTISRRCHIYRTVVEGAE